MSCRQSGAASPSPGVFGLGAVLVRVPGRAPGGGGPAGRPPARTPRGRRPGTPRRPGPGPGRRRPAEVGGQVGALVVPARGQVGDLVQARDRGVGAGDAAQQLLVELPGGGGAAVADLPVHGRPAVPAAEVPGLAQRGLRGCGLRGRGAHRPGSFPASPGGGGDQADPVSVVQEHGQGASAVPADVELAGPRVVAGDGSLVAGPEPGVRVVGVLKGDPVAALEPAADVRDLADPGEQDVQLGDGRPGAQALAGPGVGHHGSGGLDDQVRAGEDDDAGDPRAGVGDLGLQLVVVPGGDVRGLAGQGLRVGHREAVQLV